MPMSTICGGGLFNETREATPRPPLPLRERAGVRVRALCRGKVMPAVLAACVCSAHAAAPIPRTSVITFNTACARCHEAECSGRLSFVGGKEGAAGHIRRYTGPLPDLGVSELFDLLKYMKESCAFYPFEAPVPERVWGREELQALYSPAGNGYFIPMGTLEPGCYTIALRFEQETEARLQVVTPSFSFLVDKSGIASRGMFEAEFVAEVQGPYFLRLYPAEPARLADMKVKFHRAP